MTNKFTPDWPYRYEYVRADGEIYPARIVANDRRGGAPLLVLVDWGGDNGEGIGTFKVDGTSPSWEGRLRNRPNPAAVKPIFEERWCNTSAGHLTDVYRGVKNAEKNAAHFRTRIAVPCFLIEQSLAETGRDEFPAAVREWALPTSQNVVIYAAICDFLSHNPDWLIVRKPQQET